MASQVYKPIESAIGQFRTLNIRPAKNPTDEIRCDLVYSLLGNHPEYEALPYTWGCPAPDPGKSVLVDSQHFPIFENLFAALLRLRQTSKPGMIWIDAICINKGKNQEAAREREQQLLLMRQTMSKLSKY